jgi:hypothetical protein
MGAREAETSANALRHMWLVLCRSQWRSMAVVPADRETSSREVVDVLDELARFFDLGTFKLVDAESASLPSATRAAEDLAHPADPALRTVFCVASPLHHAGAVPIVLAAERALLLVQVGATRLEAAHRLVELIGRERVVGCVATRRRARNAAPGRAGSDAGVTVLR